MRTGKPLIQASKDFAVENRFRSWYEALITIVLIGISLTITFLPIPLYARLISSVFCGLIYVRMFVIYHDYQHNAILQNSAVASILMNAFGIYLLAPRNIWKRSHDHHHNHNSKLTLAGIGSYPTVSKNKFLTLSKGERTLYLINRHPVTILLGYFTLFIYWLNVKSFIQSPAKHMDSLVALIVHFAIGTLIYIYTGPVGLLISWILPFLITFGMGAYLFYCQHNFPQAQFRENHDWTYDNAALTSTSYMVMSPVMNWFTGNIGYHHVHHLNSRIPFYRLPEVMAAMPELQHPFTTSWNPIEMMRCFRLKLWDSEAGKMITLKQMSTHKQLS